MDGMVYCKLEVQDLLASPFRTAGVSPEELADLNDLPESRGSTDLVRPLCTKNPFPRGLTFDEIKNLL